MLEKWYFSCRYGFRFYCTNLKISRVNAGERLSSIESFTPDRIRNFGIVAHVDHGKSSLADKLLQMTGVITDQEQDQFLDKLQVERDRGITVKAQTCSMVYKSHLLNLIDTPGHADFSFEVSRSLAVCDGVVFLVAANQGVQAQTLANFWLAFNNDLKMIPVINKIDIREANVEAVQNQLNTLFDFQPEEVLRISAKNGVNIDTVLDTLITRCPPPTVSPNDPFKALIFDSWYDQYRGAIAMISVKAGSIKKGQKISSFNEKKTYEVLEVLSAGQIGYIICNMKTVREAAVGETLFDPVEQDKVVPFPGFSAIQPTVYSGLFPVNSAQYEDLRMAVERLCLNDPSVVITPDSSSALGLGWRVGFLGVLHMEVFSQRLEQEYDADVILTSPSVEYRAIIKDNDTIRKKRYAGKGEIVFSDPSNFPELTDVEKFLEPVVQLTVIVPLEYLNTVNSLCSECRGERGDVSFIDNDRVIVKSKIPLAEVVVDFFERLKKLTSGYASFDYEPTGYQEANLVKLGVSINGKHIDEFSLITPSSQATAKAKTLVSKLKMEIPRQQYDVNIKATVGNSTKAIVQGTIRAYKKDFSQLLKGNFGGGGMERLNKKLSHQKKGKERMKMIGQIQVPKEAFINTMSDFLNGIASLTKTVQDTLNSYEVRKISDKVQNYVMNFTEPEMKVREATSEEAWGPTPDMMREIAGLTFQYDAFPEVMGMLWKRMLPPSPVAWRHTYKSLLLLEYLLKNGCERVIASARDHAFEMRSLERYKCTDERGRDQGVNEDDELLRQERLKAKSASRDDKYRGYSRDDMVMRGGSNFSSSSKNYRSNRYDDEDCRNDGRYDRDDRFDDEKSNKREVTSFGFDDEKRSASPELGIRLDSPHKDNDEDDEFGDFTVARSNINNAAKTAGNNKDSFDFGGFASSLPPPPTSTTSKPAASNKIIDDDLFGFSNAATAEKKKDEFDFLGLGSDSQPTSSIRPPSGPSSPTLGGDLFGAPSNSKPTDDFLFGAPSNSSKVSDDLFGISAPAKSVQDSSFDFLGLSSPSPGAQPFPSQTPQSKSDDFLNSLQSVPPQTKSPDTKGTAGAQNNQANKSALWNDLSGSLDLDNLLSTKPKQSMSMNEMKSRQGMTSCKEMRIRIFEFFVLLFFGLNNSLILANELFDKSIPDEETHLTDMDFLAARTFTDPGMFHGKVNDSAMYRKDRFEGDIVNSGLNGRTMKHFLEENGLGKIPGIMRNAVKQTYLMWTDGRIPYTISSQYSSFSRSKIAEAIEEYRRLTCIDFAPKSAADQDYIHIVPDDGCYSLVGRIGGKQPVSLGDGCIQKGIIIHELMHAVGFFHEQSRADRDDYVTINWNNVEAGLQDQFDKYSLNMIDHLDTTYDYGSVMHYASTAFSKNGKPTIEPKKKGVEIGQRTGFSETDIYKINKLYKCSQFVSTTASPEDTLSEVLKPGNKTTDSSTDKGSGENPHEEIENISGGVVSGGSGKGSGHCRDRRRDCEFLSRSGHCESRFSKKFMAENCPKSCHKCKSTCEDTRSWCERWANSGMCTQSIFKEYMKQKCAKSCQLC
ncbi:hypothetical protein FO519_000555 [Halicephalobus sp. NKZ332]|nr:hypothetical protein FO519_000555 [Halicephalobus sp. NKZ332]